MQVPVEAISVRSPRDEIAGDYKPSYIGAGNGT